MQFESENYYQSGLSLAESLRLKEIGLIDNTSTSLDNVGNIDGNTDNAKPKPRKMQNLFNDTQKQEQGLRIALNGFYSDSERKEAVNWFNDNFEKLPTNSDISLIEFDEVLSSGHIRHIKNATITAENTSKFYNSINHGINNSKGIVLDSYVTIINSLKNKVYHL